MRKKILTSEHFSNGNSNYFFDYCEAANHTNFVNIVRSVYQGDGSYIRSSIPFFQEDLFNLVQALTSLFQSAAYLDSQDKTIYDLYRENKRCRERGIKSWEPEKRPREKMLCLGVEAMSDAELLAIIIGSGTPDETAVGLAQRILDSVDDKLHRLSALGFADLCNFKGMGMAKSSSIIATQEIARRIYRLMEFLRIK
ncbi:hypothetical protein HDF26_002296 [Pedobacter cryoconitis]|uniref:UPF0758 domain-containing protein n=1 Tax=Pedobacter cryoconitis TaxID=188932 RepID=UPI0016199C14|nr:UPF0758 domain-containing protein [Pedobacter cryoconitis]MBB6271839.1 hypothetical protein [Pedobacter cryoconitis]